MLLETDRLLVRRFTPEDAAALHAVISDPEVMRYLEPPFSLEQTESFILQNGLCDPPLVYAMVWKEKAADPVIARSEATRQSVSPPLIGHLIWHPWDESAMELGWVLRRDFWGRGLAKELTTALLARTGKDVILECSPEQAVTRHLAELFGFVPEDTQPGLLRYRKRK